MVFYLHINSNQQDITILFPSVCKPTHHDYGHAVLSSLSHPSYSLGQVQHIHLCMSRINRNLASSFLPSTQNRRPDYFRIHLPQGATHVNHQDSGLAVFAFASSRSSSTLSPHRYLRLRFLLIAIFVSSFATSPSSSHLSVRPKRGEAQQKAQGE
ncbi:hypothetical protein OUZ56_014738 [Daphnia magna]|uniref:Uncharacterized protein n=1 Tax=Daphnia magna TaxID=35525 RepID=A0ABR0AKQ6_9CRUS|nr:hypothetical protein OUZ56_014738 [Daphnia magna]